MILFRKIDFKNSISLIAFLIVTFTVSSQSIVQGRIINGENNPIPGANVRIAGTQDIGTSDFDGNFSITTNEEPPFTIIVTYIGFQEYEQIVENLNEFIIVDLGVSPFIYDPVAVGRNEFPMSAAIKRKFHNRRIHCGAVILNERWLITAGHCFQSLSNKTGDIKTLRFSKGRVFVSTGSINHKEGKKSEIENIFPYEYKGEKYLPPETLYDLLLIKLEEPLSLSGNNPRNVEIIDESELILSYDGLSAVAVGWGSTKNETAPEELKKTELGITSYNDCLENVAMASRLSKTEICMGPKDKNVFCSADSGGGVFLKINGKVKLMGIITTGSTCENEGTHNNQYSTFQNLVFYKSWIDKTIADNSKE
ncbi:trypsin-like serine protease [Pareuzebyella sediminis]|uniref:trypsin-like serine protease n=1 Tax=Pareuzebyella sediminis TaxID=2607998 RepID=UPI0011EF31AF|nr:trypsin-like serine protease [Pareuzebyella sediminis]